jgi:hypothetical protein
MEKRQDFFVLAVGVLSIWLGFRLFKTILEAESRPAQKATASS